MSKKTPIQSQLRDKKKASVSCNHLCIKCTKIRSHCLIWMRFGVSIIFWTTTMNESIWNGWLVWMITLHFFPSFVIVSRSMLSIREFQWTVRYGSFCLKKSKLNVQVHFLIIEVYKCRCLIKCKISYIPMFHVFSSIMYLYGCY